MSDFNRRITGGDAVRSVLKTLGLPAPATISSTTDATALQMWALASDVGQKLLTEHPWQVLNRDMTITTVIGQAAYDLPTDFAGFTPDAAWNYSTQLPALGSLTDVEWQALKARATSATIESLFQVANDQVVLYNTPTAVQTIKLPYTSRGWVRTNGGSTYKDTLEQDDDVVLYDPQLFKTALKLAWSSAKGFDITKLLLEYRAVLSSAKGTDFPSRTLRLVGASEFPYLGQLNIPDTGYGS